jgi:hypothetical protein
MSVSKDAVQKLVGPIAKWLENGGDPWAVNLEYWRVRRQLMNEGEMFAGPPSEILSNIDTAMDSFSPEEDRGPHQIDEVQLRSELELALNRLRAGGYIDS